VMSVGSRRRLVQGVHALLDGEQRRRLERVHVAAAAYCHGPGSGGPVIGEVDDSDEVIVAKAEEQALDRPAQCLCRWSHPLDDALRLTTHGGPRLCRITHLHEVLRHGDLSRPPPKHSKPCGECHAGHLAWAVVVTLSCPTKRCTAEISTPASRTSDTQERRRSGGEKARTLALAARAWRMAQTAWSVLRRTTTLPGLGDKTEQGLGR